MGNKMIVAKRQGQTYYEINLDQQDVPSYVIQRVIAAVQLLLNPKYFVFWGNKSMLFVDCAMFDALLIDEEIYASTQTIAVI